MFFIAAQFFHVTRHVTLHVIQLVKSTCYRKVTPSDLESFKPSSQSNASVLNYEKTPIVRESRYTASLYERRVCYLLVNSTLCDVIEKALEERKNEIIFIRYRIIAKLNSVYI